MWACCGIEFARLISWTSERPTTEKCNSPCRALAHGLDTEHCSTVRTSVRGTVSASLRKSRLARPEKLAQHHRSSRALWQTPHVVALCVVFLVWFFFCLVLRVLFLVLLQVLLRLFQSDSSSPAGRPVYRPFRPSSHQSPSGLYTRRLTNHQPTNPHYDYDP